MIFAAYFFALLLCMQLPSPHNITFGLVVIFTFPRVLRWVRSFL